MKLRLFLITILSFLCILTVASANVIWEEKKTETITHGVSHTYYVHFDESGWTRTHVLEIDLENENLDLAVLFSENGISKLQPLPEMAKNAGVVAAVNGDFFNFDGSPLGFTVEDGTVISSPSHDTGLAALMEDENGYLFTEYVKMHLVVTSPEGYKVPIIHINKHHSMESMVLYTKDWGKKTPGSHNGISEMVVIDGVCAEIRRDKDGISVPENGYVLATSTLTSTFLVDNFVPGDKVELSYTIEPDFGEIKTAIGGGSVLVQDGKRATFTNVISGTHPRTAAGIDKSGKKLILVTVDGRQTATKGMTQTELADYMISLGAYAAINLDGGGSTTMVLRNGEKNVLETVNTPSDGTARAIATGLGVRFSGEAGSLHTIEVNYDGNIAHEGDAIHLYLGAYDENHNPLYIADKPITYTSKDGTFQNNVFYPAHAGKCTVTASCEDISGSLEIEVLKTPLPFAKTPPKEAETLFLLPSAPSPKTLLDTLTKNRLEALEKAEKGKVCRIGNADVDFEIRDTCFISINTKNGGIRQTDADGWRKITALCDRKDIKHIFISLSHPMSTFNDKQEKDLLYRFLTEELRKNGQDVYLIEPGNKTEVREENGIRILTVAATADIGIQDFYGDCQAKSGLRLSFGDGQIYYETVPLWEVIKLQKPIK